MLFPYFERSLLKLTYFCNIFILVVLDVEVDVAGIGKVRVDIGYGGAFYALVHDDALHLEVKQSKTTDLARAGTAVSGL